MEVIKTALRLAIPGSLFEWNLRRRQNDASVRFGTLADVMKKG
jgi:hypothetical protein